MHMAAKVAIIGGTGIGERLRALPGTPLHIATSSGCIRAKQVQTEAGEIVVLSRHSAGHKVPPHRVPYQGIADALPILGITKCFATAAVGSLRTEWGPGTLVVADDLIDASARNQTRFELTIGHTDMTSPFGKAEDSPLSMAAAKLGIEVKKGGTYLNVNGPRYESAAEIRMMQGWGADVVGMTAGSEAIAMAEAGIPYHCLCIVTNLGTGLHPTELSHGEVEHVMKSSGETAVKILLEAARMVQRGEC